MSTSITEAATASVAPDLKSRWQDFRRANPKTRARDAATQLGVTEAELVATGCGENVTRLVAPESDWGGLVEGLGAFGRVMALTRNNEAVHERQGAYSRTEFFPSHKMGQVLDEGIDLRLFFTTWAHAFAIDEAGKDDARKRSIQFFSASGEAIHKTFLQGESDAEAFADFVARHASDDQTHAVDVMSALPVSAEKPDSEIDIQSFRDDWSKLTNTHEFFALTRKHNVTRTQALRLAAPDMVHQVGNSSLRSALQQVAASELPIMIFVGNPGCIQIHSGAVSNIKPVREWLNVLDADFNLHVREDLIHTSWLVRKPTTEGIVTSLELYNAAGEQILLMFSKRTDYKEESESWRALLASMPGV